MNFLHIDIDCKLFRSTSNMYSVLSMSVSLVRNSTESCKLFHPTSNMYSVLSMSIVRNSTVLRFYVLYYCIIILCFSYLAMSCKCL